MIKNLFLYRWLKNSYYSLKDKFYNVRGRNNKVVSKEGWVNSNYSIYGNDNQVFFSEKCFLKDTTVHIRGNSNRIFFEQSVFMYGGELWIENDGCEIYVGAGTTIQKAHIAVTEDKQSVRIGEDCMLSTNIEIRTGDSHSIIDVSTQKRINPAASVVIGNHVWVGSNVSILKGVEIGDDSIIGTGSLVTKAIPQQCLAVGSPARVVKTQVSWKRERI